ncbi:T9SS type A sorting domain-containing protein [Aureispira anguillae]|uniref:T9SS type A sorting domain-containing protein n=1 Tax=Aureispira anguillae TaxID=2864201 RepID=A0A915YE11_9BACT|nr:T9SS type A sorting domain-containing protein [Aureispira anguillae]BDS11378.1 T9SS type A sorting domain-containing protein [Aureispira anguillae]
MKHSRSFSISSFLIIFFLLTFLRANAQLDLEWVNILERPVGPGGGSSVMAPIISLDDFGNVYSTGIFYDTLDFDPGIGVNHLVSPTSKSFFVQKYDPSGNLIWLRYFEHSQSSNVFISSFSTDVNGNSYVIGTFKDTITFNTVSGVDTLTKEWISFANGNNCFILKIDANGNTLWAKELRGGETTGSQCHLDNQGNLCIVGFFQGEIDFDPGSNNNILASTQIPNNNLNNWTRDIFALKLDANGNFIWAKTFGGSTAYPVLFNSSLDALNNLYIIGRYSDTIDFDPGPAVASLNSSHHDLFLLKLDDLGNFDWVKSSVLGSNSNVITATGITIDSDTNIVLSGSFVGTVDFDFGAGTQQLTSTGYSDGYILKLTPQGNFIWVKKLTDTGISLSLLDNSNNLYCAGMTGSGAPDLDPGTGIFTASQNAQYLLKLSSQGDFIWANISSEWAFNPNHLELDNDNNLYQSGTFKSIVDFDPTADVYLLESLDGLTPTRFYRKLSQKGIYGSVFQDFNQNCTLDSFEVGLERLLEIQPGNILVTSTLGGIWSVDSLAPGNYTITVDTSGGWSATCSSTQTFTVPSYDTLISVGGIGLIANNPCTDNHVTIDALSLRPGFSNQIIFVEACNNLLASDILDSAYVILEFDDRLTIESATMPLDTLGNNRYGVYIGRLAPSQCQTVVLFCHIDSTILLGESLCMKATLHPIHNCFLDTIPKPYPNNFSPCVTPYDLSHLEIGSTCNGTNISFKIKNTGSGNMSCWSPVNLYVDGQFISRDSVQLTAGDSMVYNYGADGRTWRMEVCQHPLHPGNSNPSTTIELCGPEANWTPDLVNLLPHDDGDSHVDITCVVVSGAYDPNDKMGFPLGIGANHEIDANEQIEYLIRFQNTGTDTAFTVVIRDTLSSELDVFSVRSGASSHNYHFRIYGERVLEWTFYDILLPDSLTNLEGSNGFVRFSVDQNPDLPIGTRIENTASIYFDFNLPIVTNTYFHTIGAPQINNSMGSDTIDVTACDSVLYNGVLYNSDGNYLQTIQNNGNDTLYLINVDILNNFSHIDTIICDSFEMNGQYYTTSGNYSSVYSNYWGCDSTVYLDLTVENTIDTSITQNGTILTANAIGYNYQWVDCDNNNNPILGATNRSFSPLANGNYAVIISNINCSEVSSCIPITTVNVSKIEASFDVNIYPNPVENILFIENANNRQIQYSLVNQLGEVLLMNNTPDKELIKIDIKGLSTGVYYLFIQSNRGILSKKVIKI